MEYEYKSDNQHSSNTDSKNSGIDIDWLSVNSGTDSLQM